MKSDYDRQHKGFAVLLCWDYCFYHICSTIRRENVCDYHVKSYENDSFLRKSLIFVANMTNKAYLLGSEGPQRVQLQEDREQIRSYGCGPNVGIIDTIFFR